jgi:Family of unknown function (DUF6104)
MYFTDRGIEELEERRGDEQITVAWLAERLRDFVDLNPDFETAVDRLASWLARLDDEEDSLCRTGSGERPGTCVITADASPRRPCGVRTGSTARARRRDRASRRARTWMLAVAQLGCPA